MRRVVVAMVLASLCISAVAGPEITEKDRRRARELTSRMTLEEKMDFISGHTDGFCTAGIERLGIPSIRMADGPQGVRNIGGKNIESTFYPCGISAAASWNRDAVREMGAGIGRAARAAGVQIMLGPGVNIYRSALCGRNFEYYGEDPYLAGETALSYICGLQEQGVMATIKHFATNQEEYDRHGVSSNVDGRALNEIYFPSFKKAIQKGHVGAVMTSYNPVNGTHAAENPYLTDLLRSWGHDGLVMTDWVSTYSPVAYMQAEVDLEMPKAFVTKPEVLRELLDNGAITVADLDRRCEHILASFSAYGFLDGTPSADPAAEDKALSDRRAYEVALEGPVLIKNEDNVLPIKKGSKIALIGPNANAIVCGGGSGWVNPQDGKGTTPYSGLTALGKQYQVTLLGTPAPAVLSKVDVVVVCLGFNRDTEKEGSDRKYTLGSYQNDMVERVAKYNKNVVVVVNSGGEFGMRWFGRAKAILLDWYPGQEGGSALAALLTGKVSPSGRLPFTWWGTLDANPVQKWYPSVSVTPSRDRDEYYFTEYKESIFLGYRGVEHFGAKPQYPFGYGLTYTDFEYSGLTVTAAADGGVDVVFTVRNAGKAEAKEVAQVYVSAPEDAPAVYPARELKGFDKKSIAPGKSAVYKIHLDADAFARYDTASHGWVTDSGLWKIQVGASSADIRLSADLHK